MKTKPIVGQRVFLLNIGNNARNQEQRLTPLVVTKVGSKYFSAKLEQFNFTRQYHLTSGLEKSDFMPGGKIYESEQEWEDEKESRETVDRIWETFSHGNAGRRFGLETLRKLKVLIDAELLQMASR